MIDHKFLNEQREKIREKNDSLTRNRADWIKSGSYFYRQIIDSLRYIIDEDAKLLHIGCEIGFMLDAINPRRGVGVDDSSLQIAEAKKNYPRYTFLNTNPESLDLDEKFDFILITWVEDIVDIKAVLDAVRQCCHPHTRIVMVNYNYLWSPLVALAEAIKIKCPQKLHNWISTSDLDNLLRLSGYETVVVKKRMLYPFAFPLLADFLNRVVARLPLLRDLSYVRITVGRPLLPATREYSVSVVIPCRNEAGNIADAVQRIPHMGTHTEIIFGDDKSTDGTADKVREMIKAHPEKDIKLVDGPGICKAENVWTGFDAASGDILMILDADLTVIPEELPYFYEAIARGYGEFINGSRLVYPMHEDAMRLFNVIGNKFFSMAFTYILDTPIKDTLCGTKVIWRRDYARVKKLRGYWQIKDRWGDYELIFGAAKCHLKIVDLPVHYCERVYGETKMTNRFRNGWNMLKMCWFALWKIKFS